jgi:serine phosphatase RsbU (regulator of sigma subunit)
MNASGDLYGDAALAASVACHAHGTATDMRDAILGDVRHFVDGAEPHDDLTLVVLKLDDGRGESHA